MVRSLMVLLISFFSIELNSQDFYISDEFGLDTNNGSEESPFKTINRGILEVEAGGTVYVMNGTYRNSGFGTVDTSTNTNMNNPHVVTINKSGTEGAYITLKKLSRSYPKN